MKFLLKIAVFLSMGYNVQLDPSMNFNVKEAVFEPIMLAKKAPHVKGSNDRQNPDGVEEPWPPYDFSKFDSYLNNVKEAADSESPEHNRIKRKTKKSRRKSSTPFPYNRLYELYKNSTSKTDSSTEKSKKNNFDTYESPLRKFDEMFIEMPKDLYQAHLRPGVIFRIHMSEAILKMQYRNYAEDKDESVIEADVEYLRLTRKVINDDITKFEDLKWLVDWFGNRTDLINEHVCNTRYFAVGIPPTMFTHSEEYMKRLCLFDNVYLDHIPYVIGDDGSLMAAVAPPVLHCDAATCTSVPFIDSLMFDERLPRTNVRTVTRCQASCRAHCRNDADCLTRCSDRCARPD